MKPHFTLDDEKNLRDRPVRGRAYSHRTIGSLNKRIGVFGSSYDVGFRLVQVKKRK